jgi:ABC-type transport system substrate-binding protein
MKRLLAFVACLLLGGAVAAAPQKTLRYAFLVAETGLDPARINDTYSRTLTSHIYEAPYKFDHLARPVKLKALTAAGMPQHSPDFRTWTVKIRPGIFFADDPAFRGVRRELVAQDYVYSIKRFADPANKSPVWTGLADEKILGLAELRQQALDQKKPFDYDREIEGLRALDRYTLQVKVAEPRPRFAESLADSSLLGAVAREVVEHYGDRIDEHPVGTGPFRLAQWRRRSLIVLERNPGFREMFYDAEPAADDAEGQALVKRFKGRRLPMVDRVEISIIEEHQPRWLAFLNGEADFVERVDAQFIHSAMPAGRVAPNLAKKGVRGYRQIEAGSTYYFFNMEDPVVGGYTPDKVALRRAIGLGLDLDAEIRLLRRGQAVPAQSPVLPHTSGYDPNFKSEFSDHDLPRAKALLDLFGFVDRDGDGWRDMPDGSPLVLRMATEPDQRSRQFDELTKKDLDALGVRVSFEIAQWPENLKAARAGKLAIWQLAGVAAGSDGQSSLARFDSKQIGGQNMARFKHPPFDALLERMRVIEDGPERDALFNQAKRLALAYMPYKFRVHRLLTDMAYPWMAGYRRPVLWNDWWHYVDIDTDELARRQR